MKLDYLSCPIYAEKYNIDEQELEGQPLEDQVQLVADKMQQFEDKHTTLKKECDQKRYQLLAEAQNMKVKRNQFKAKADIARENRGRLRKEYRDNLPLIKEKIKKAKK